MKKVLLVLFVGAVLALAGCKKERTCECTTSYTGEGTEMMQDVVVEVTIEGEKCETMDVSTTVGEITTSVVCVEK